MILDSKGRSFIQAREAFRANAYKDDANVTTIGYGTTIYPNGGKVKITDQCTQEQALAYFMHDIEYFENVVTAQTDKHIHLTQNQFNALVSFVYNIGGLRYATSTVRKMVNTGEKDDKQAISNAFLMWDNITVRGKLVHSDGLENRRRKEIELYFS